MESFKRRWWTALVTVAATTIIVGAALSGLFQLAVISVPEYRAQLESWVTRAAGRPVQIGGVSLGWRGLNPRLDLSGITLYSDDESEQLSVERLRLGISLWRALGGHLLPTRMEINGLRVSARVDERGRLHIAGLNPGDDPSRMAWFKSRWLEGLRRFELLKLSNCAVYLHADALGAAPLALQVDGLEWMPTANGFTTGGKLTLPAEFGGTVALQAQIDGELAEMNTWRGTFSLTAQDLRPQAWLGSWLQPGTQLASAGLEARLSGRIDSGHLASARIGVDADALVLARTQVLSSAARAQLVADYRRRPQGFELDVGSLRFDETEALHARLHSQRDADARSLALDADTIDLGVLAPWLDVWRIAPAWLDALAGARGRVQALVLRARLPQAADALPQYSLTARLDGVGLQSADYALDGLKGALSADENGGQLMLDDAPLDLALGKVFSAPLRLDGVRGALAWRRLVDGWRLLGEQLEWNYAGAVGSGRLALTLPSAQGASPLLDLDARFTAPDVTVAKAWMPTHWHPHLKQWLDRAIVAGRVADARLQINGPLADFPFHKRPTGHWQLDLDAADATLAFLPDWPSIEAIAAHLTFTGNELSITASGGELLGNPIDHAQVRFADFNDHRFTVEARSHGDLANYYRFLRGSPLRTRLRGLLDHTQGWGPAELDLKLDIPLIKGEWPKVAGAVTLDDASLRYARIEPAISAIRGTVDFTEHGAEARAVGGQFGETELALRIDPQADTHGVIRGSFAVDPHSDARGAAQFLPGFLRAAVQGASRWSFELPLVDDAASLLLWSALEGTTVSLPAPLGKTADEALTTRLRIGATDPQSTWVAINYGDRLDANLRVTTQVDAPADAPAVVDGLSVRLGGEQAPLAVSGVRQLDGRLPTLDLAAWGALLGGGAGQGVAFDRMVIDADELRWGALVTGRTQVDWRPQADGWLTTLSGDGGQGELHWQQEEKRLSANLRRLRLLALPGAQIAGRPVAAGAEIPIDPAQLPALDLRCDDFVLGDEPMGALTLDASRITDGLSVQALDLSGGAYDARLNGNWTRQAGRSTADFEFSLDTSQIERLLPAFGYAPSLSAEQTRLSGALHWKPAAKGLRWEMAGGRIDVLARNGQLRAVKPGASRVLGLLNFYALPRRLFLDFDDVVDKGLGFDQIGGHFELADGLAHTPDLDIRGPSLRLEIRGDVNLATRAYDQHVTVYPGLSGGVTLGAVLLGGPAVGALVLLAQELLQKPLDQVTQFSYRITGPWDNPEVVRDPASGAGGAAGTH